MVIMVKDYEKIYIIGNGFDKANHRPTSYEDFRNFLIYGQLVERDDEGNKYEYGKNHKQDNIIEPTFDENDYVSIPESKQMPDGDERFNETELKQWYVRFIDNNYYSDCKSHCSCNESHCSCDKSLWSYYEDTLGHLDANIDDNFNLMQEIMDSPDDNEWELAENNNLKANQLFQAVTEIHNYFESWIQSVEENKVVKLPEIDNFLDPSAFYLSFNYTDTLEKYYGIQSSNITHIHGYKANISQKDDCQKNSKLIVGHGMDDTNDTDEQYPEAYALDDIHNNLKKDVLGIIEKNQELWDKISHVKDIYCFGFSFGKVDMPYIEKIISSSAPHCCWHLNKFDEEESMEQKEKLKKLGIPEHEIKIEKFY